MRKVILIITVIALILSILSTGLLVLVDVKTSNNDNPTVLSGDWFVSKK